MVNAKGTVNAIGDFCRKMGGVINFRDFYFLRKKDLSLIFCVYFFLDMEKERMPPYGGIPIKLYGRSIQKMDTPSSGRL
jgi:hypothetical protein